MKNYKNIKENVKDLIVKNRHLADNNTALYRYYINSYTNFNTQARFIDISVAIEEGHLPPVSTIERASRQIQEENPYLRSYKWYIRKKLEVPTMLIVGTSNFLRIYHL